MPRYFFDIDDGQRFTVDDEGSDLAGPRAAREEAVSALPAILRELPIEGDGRTLTATVRDEKGRVLLQATVTLRLEWRGPRLL